MFMRTLLKCCSMQPRKLKQSWILIQYYHDKTNMVIPSASISQIKKILRQRNVNFLDGHSCIAFSCPICNDQKLKERKIFLNKATGKFLQNNINNVKVINLFIIFIYQQVYLSVRNVDTLDHGIF